MLTTLVMIAALGQVPAQNVRPQIGYVYPPGGRAGTTIDVRIGTYDWTPDMQIVPHDPRLKIEITGQMGDYILTPPPYWFGLKAGQPQPPLAREVPARITLPADLPLGKIRWQVANANGGSGVNSFVVSDTAEFLEPEKHSGPPMLPELPVTANGRLTRISEIDEYRFTVAAAGPVTCRLEDRLGQPFHALLTIRDEQGRIVVDSADTTGSGIDMMFLGQPGKTYTAQVHDLEFAGDAAYVYRLSLRQGPRVVATLPLLVARGKATSVEFIGEFSQPGKLESIIHEVSVPKEAAGDVLTFVFETPAGQARASITIAELADAAPPTASDDSPPMVEARVAFSTALEQIDPMFGMPAQRFRFTLKKGESLRLLAEAERFGSTVDPTLVILSAEGKELARNDDVPGTSDAALDFKAAVEGTYELAVLDVSGLPPARTSVLRVAVSAAEPDFSLTVPDQFSVPLGGTADLPLKVVRQGTWKEPIAVRLEGLPDGAAILGAAEIPQGKNDLKLSLAGSDKAAVAHSLATLVATAKVGERTIEHRYGPILVTTTLKTRCQVKSAVQDGGRIVNRGTTYPADVIIERLEGYEGPVTLQMAATQQRQRRGIAGQTIVVPADQRTAQFPVHMPEWLETSLTARMNVIGVVQVPDPQGNLRHVTGAMDGFIVMSLEGALVKLSHEPGEYTVRAGEMIQIPLRVSRSATLAETARLELGPHQELSEHIAVDPVELARDQTTAILRLRLAKDTPPGRQQVTLRATVLQHGRWPAISETTVPLIVLPSINSAGD